MINQEVLSILQKELIEEGYPELATYLPCTIGTNSRKVQRRPARELRERARQIGEKNFFKLTEAAEEYAEKQALEQLLSSCDYPVDFWNSDLSIQSDILDIRGYQELKQHYPTILLYIIALNPICMQKYGDKVYVSNCLSYGRGPIKIYNGKTSFIIDYEEFDPSNPFKKKQHKKDTLKEKYLKTEKGLRDKSLYEINRMTNSIIKEWELPEELQEEGELKSIKMSVSTLNETGATFINEILSLKVEIPYEILLKHSNIKTS